MPISVSGQDGWEWVGMRRDIVSNEVGGRGSAAALRRTSRRLATIATVACLAVLLPTPLSASAARSPGGKTTTSGWQVKTTGDRVQVLDADGVVATFTVGARTVNVRGTSRVLAEPSTTTATVTSKTRVRLLPQPFSGTVNRDWLTAALADTSPDLVELATQYLPGAPEVRDARGALLSSDASYGPLQADGTRQEGSDFNDYLGVAWTYGATTDAPEANQYAALDCSGYVRMVFGYRAGMKLTLDPDGVGLPRRAVQMAASAPGVVTVPNAGTQPTSTSTLLPGDLVFFDASTDDGTAIDHVGMYLGTDSTGAARFVSSRKTADGPTLGDLGGRSTLTGTGYWAAAWRSARRL